MTRRHLFTLFVCIGLAAQGFVFVLSADAQKRSSRQASLRSTSATDKPGTEAKIKAARQRAKNSSTAELAAGDPCFSDVPIAVGQTLAGSLATGDCDYFGDGTFVDFYSFNGTVGQAINVSLTSSAFDAFVFLADSGRDLIASNDDGLGGTNSRIPADSGVIILPYTGTFYIGANSFSPASGAYNVSLGTDAACTVTPLTYNQTVNGTLAGSDCPVNLGGDIYNTDIFTFNGTAGDQISITQTSAAVDSYLVMRSPSGQNSLEDNDSGGAPNARIPETGTLTLTETGLYSIEASSFNPGGAGDYTLTLTGPNVNPAASTPFDFDGDGRADVAVFRPSDNTWYGSLSQEGYRFRTFGEPNDVPVPADYDGGGTTDIAVWRPSNGTWYVISSETDAFTGVAWGVNGDIPVPADYDGDGSADLAVFRPYDNTWYRMFSGGGFSYVTFGVDGDIPVLGDFDGDGKTDVSVYRPSDNT
ncbi:MAG: pre-peptidase C-terminal domain-containing protein, partial [Acidobacteriota bacterium]